MDDEDRNDAGEKGVLVPQVAARCEQSRFSLSFLDVAVAVAIAVSVVVVIVIVIVSS